jgi:hypothetical protein
MKQHFRPSIPSSAKARRCIDNLNPFSFSCIFLSDRVRSEWRARAFASLLPLPFSVRDFGRRFRSSLLLLQAKLASDNRWQWSPPPQIGLWECAILYWCAAVFIKCRTAVSTRWCSGWDSASSHKGTDSDLIHAYRTYLSRLSRTPGDDDDDDLVQDS